MFSGERLEEIRKDKKLNQEQLAKMIGVSTTTISAYERGDMNPKVSTLIKIAEILDISLDYLCGITNEEISYSRDNFVVLPRNCSPEFKKRSFASYQHFKRARI